MKLDVHNLFLKDAIDEIMFKFDECKEIGDNSLEIIHGYKHGTKIRDYLRSEGFLNDATQNGHIIISKDFSDNGATVFQLKPLKNFSRNKPILKLESPKNVNKNKTSGIYCIKCKKAMTLLKEFNWYKCPKCGKLTKR
ncbi:MAG: Smr/MutS family protein [Promethearchaeota archaeon]